MDFLVDGIRWVHVSAGFVGLAAFWVPIFAHKGGINHRFFGKIFKYCAYIVLGGAMLSVVLHIGVGLSEGAGPRQSPGSFAFVVFLGYLAFVTFIGLRHGLQVLENKKDIMTMDTSVNRSMAWLAIFASAGLITYNIYFQPPNMIVLFALSPIGFGIGSGILKAIKGKRPEKKVWFYEHMGAMIGTGIAFHTAFAVFGISRLFDLGLDGWIAVIPWILPALIGIPGTVIWTRYYKRKFNDYGPAVAVEAESGA
ncbi:MAG: hypothetical protein ACI9HY_001011 [Planctomycetaceae bacterium]|jgi:hypothetical protein